MNTDIYVSNQQKTLEKGVTKYSKLTIRISEQRH